MCHISKASMFLASLMEPLHNHHKSFKILQVQLQQPRPDFFSLSAHSSTAVFILCLLSTTTVCFCLTNVMFNNFKPQELRRISVTANLAPHYHEIPNQTTTKHSNRERGRETNEVVEMQKEIKNVTS